MNFDFRKELLTVHESNIRCDKRLKKDNEIEVKNGDLIWLSDTANDVMEIGVDDFKDFLKTSMNVEAFVTTDKEKAKITVELAKDAGIELGEYAITRGFKIVTDENQIKVYGFDDRGAVQALYYIEDLMTFEKAPVLTYGEIVKKPAFSPQMVHSGYGFDDFPDEYLKRIAHEGRDAILVYAKDANMSIIGPVDFNDLIERARKYGIDVYAYSAIKSLVNPEAPEAEEFYESTYGKLFRECPGLKGVTLVGESVEFPSKDPHVGNIRAIGNSIDGIPTGKPSPGWYPCYDYPIYLNCIKKIIRKYNPDADIVFWTYNWGRRPKDIRLKLLETIPTDITLEATFEMGEPTFFDDARGILADYSLSFTGPGEYFKSEAEVAKRRGIKLYSMTNTGGRTWDFGVIPYEPMPYQWIKRYKNMLKAHDDWGLSGIMETHHYGFQPSFISRLSKHAFMEPRENMEELLKKILISEFGYENYEKVNNALEKLSESITYYVASRSDQYGAFRVGPSYPFNFIAQLELPTDEVGAPYGKGINAPRYRNELEYSEWPVNMRIKQELASLEKMHLLTEETVEILDSIENANEKTKKLLNLSRFISNTVKTGIHAKKWHMLINRRNVEETREGTLKIFDEMEELLNLEKKNAEATIPLVEYDSSIGWEPSMGYKTDKRRIEWKIRQLEYVIEGEINIGRQGANLLSESEMR